MLSAPLVLLAVLVCVWSLTSRTTVPFGPLSLTVVLHSGFPPMQQLAI